MLTRRFYPCSIAKPKQSEIEFNWRKLYQAGQLGGHGAKLLPVKVTSESLPLTTGSGSSVPSSRGTIHIQLRHAQVSVEGNVDAGLLRVLLESLLPLYCG
jgi:hypothetical protein